MVSVAIACTHICRVANCRAAFSRRKPKKSMTVLSNTSPDWLRKRKFKFEPTIYPELIWAVIWPCKFAFSKTSGVQRPSAGRRRHFLNVLCYVRSWLVDLESCETLHPRTLKSISDGQRAVASPSVPLDRIIPHEFYTVASMGTSLRSGTAAKLLCDDQ